MVTAYYQGKYILDTLLSTLQESFIFEGELLNGNLIIYIILNSLWFHVPLILMIVVSGMLTAEFKDGTIQSALTSFLPSFSLSIVSLGLIFPFTNL